MSRQHLIFATLALAALTWGTSTHAEAPEQLMQVAVHSSISSLQSQFNLLQAKIKAEAKVTPQVQQTINTMIKLVTDEIEPSIKQAHDIDQNLINAKMKSISDLNDATQITINTLNSRAKAVRDAIAQANELSAALVDKAKAQLKGLDDFDVAVKAKTDKCCEFQNAAVPDVEYIPAYASCDYAVQTADQCVAAAQAAKDAVIFDKFQDGYSLYKKLQGECAELSNTLPDSKSAMEIAKQACQQTVADMNAQVSIVKQNLPVLQSDWTAAAQAYSGAYDGVKGQYLDTETSVKSRETDRQNEWDATQQIKCMLTSYLEGGSFDQSGLDACKSGISHLHLVIQYPALVDPLVWDLGSFDEVVTHPDDADSCDRQSKADESADEHCDIVGPNPVPNCRYGPAPAPNNPDQDGCRPAFVADSPVPSPPDRLGYCTDRLPQDAVFHLDDPFWKCMTKENPDYSTTPKDSPGCGYVVGFEGYKWLSGWAADKPALSYKPVGQGYLFLADYDWQDNEQSGQEGRSHYAFECMMNYKQIACDGSLDVAPQRTKIAICGGSSYNMEDSDHHNHFDKAVDRNDCSFDDKYVTVFITRNAQYYGSLNSDKLKSYLNNGGIVVTEYSGSNDVNNKAALLQGHGQAMALMQRLVQEDTISHVH